MPAFRAWTESETPKARGSAPCAAPPTQETGLRSTIVLAAALTTRHETANSTGFPRWPDHEVPAVSKDGWARMKNRRASPGRGSSPWREPHLPPKSRRTAPGRRVEGLDAREAAPSGGATTRGAARLVPLPQPPLYQPGWAGRRCSQRSAHDKGRRAAINRELKTRPVDWRSRSRSRSRRCRSRSRRIMTQDVLQARCTSCRAGRSHSTPQGLAGRPLWCTCRAPFACRGVGAAGGSGMRGVCALPLTEFVGRLPNL